MRRALSVAVVLALALGLTTTHARQDDTVFLFSYFTGNGEDGLHLASSDDGYRWSALHGGKALYVSTVGDALIRDPCILRGPDDRFHMVWTTGWWDKGIGLAHSDDLVTWSAPRTVPVMAHEPRALNAWAPEIVWDARAGVYVIFWATTITGRFPETADSGDESKGGRLNHRIYAVTTRDFETFSTARLFYEPGFNVIDATIVEADGRFVMIVKDETARPVAKKHLRVATAARLQGPYGAASPPVTVDWVEGPTLLRVGQEWLLYYDEYTRKRYGASRSADLRTWEVASDRIRLPEGARHGTAFAVPRSRVTRLLGLR
jgi:Glycosyl hydrolases family 43